MSQQLADQDMPDPWMCRYKDKYLLTFTSAGASQIELWSSPYLQNFYKTNPTTRTRVLWKPTNIALYELWAPELHVVDNNWYVYFAADIPPLFNAKHQMYVLKGPAATVDPMLETSAFNLVGTGPIANLPDRWAIDGTMIHLNNQWYLVYSGWPQGANNELKQELWISKMKSPTEADPAHPAASISSPTDHAWEAHTDSGGLHQINEGPAWLEIGSFRGIIFSASASWSSDYTLGVLQYVGGDPLQKSSWHKSHQQLLRDNPNGKGPWGPGHCSFISTPDGKQIWIIFHATKDKIPDGTFSFDNRTARCQLLTEQGGFPFSELYPAIPTTVLPSGIVMPASTGTTNVKLAVQNIKKVNLFRRLTAKLTKSSN